MPSAAVISNPLGAFGLNATTGIQKRQSFRNTGGSTITAGDLVVLDTTAPSTTTYPGNVPGANVTKAAATADLVTVIGFAAETAIDGAEVDVIVEGVALQVNVATGTAAGSRVASSVAAGRGAAPGTVTPGGVIGVVVGAAAAANLADVWVFKA